LVLDLLVDLKNEVSKVEKVAEGLLVLFWDRPNKPSEPHKPPKPKKVARLLFSFYIKKKHVQIIGSFPGLIHRSALMA
jgi:hypothetical protein